MFLTIAFQFEPTTYVTTTSTCTTRDIVVFAISSGATYCELDVSVFLPDCAIVGNPCCIQRRNPEKLRKGQFSPLLSQGCMQV